VAASNGSKGPAFGSVAVLLFGVLGAALFGARRGRRHGITH
jgi:hypothetical protein